MHIICHATCCQLLMYPDTNRNAFSRLHTTPWSGKARTGQLENICIWYHCTCMFLCNRMIVSVYDTMNQTRFQSCFSWVQPYTFSFIAITKTWHTWFVDRCVTHAIVSYACSNPIKHVCCVVNKHHVVPVATSAYELWAYDQLTNYEFINSTYAYDTQSEWLHPSCRMNQLISLRL